MYLFFHMFNYMLLNYILNLLQELLTVVALSKMICAVGRSFVMELTSGYADAENLLETLQDQKEIQLRLVNSNTDMNLIKCTTT